jgi:hypothetical protein
MATSLAFVRFLLLFCATVMILPVQTRAQSDALAKSEHHELGTEGVSAKVTVLRTGRPFPAGGSAFTQIKLRNTSKAKLIGAELVLEAENAAVQDVSGAQVTVSEDGTTRIAKIEKIAKGKPRTLIIELTLKESEPDAGLNKSRSNLKITLRQPGGTGETTTLGWSVANCAGGFYSEIVKVREGSGAGLNEAIKAARTKDKTRPGRWLFPPRFKSTKATRKCVHRTKRWNKRRGRYVYRCTKYEAVEPIIVGKTTPVKSERSVYNFASRYVSARAYDRELTQTRDSGWATNRVSQNLKGFLKQKNHPALCTGVISFFDYFDDRIAGFAKRADKFDDMAGKSFSLAQIRTTEAVEAVKVETVGHPGWGSAPLDLPQAKKEEALKNRVVSLTQLINNPELNQQVKEAKNAFSALRTMSDFFKSEAGKSLSPPTRSIVYRALSAIEAADYIGTVTRHYTDLRHALMGSMSTIRQAHASKCSCGS